MNAESLWKAPVSASTKSGTDGLHAHEGSTCEVSVGFRSFVEGVNSLILLKLPLDPIISCSSGRLIQLRRQPIVGQGTLTSPPPKFGDETIITCLKDNYELVQFNSSPFSAELLRLWKYSRWLRSKHYRNTRLAGSHKMPAREVPLSLVRRMCLIYTAERKNSAISLPKSVRAEGPRTWGWYPSTGKVCFLGPKRRTRLWGHDQLTNGY